MSTDLAGATVEQPAGSDGDIATRLSNIQGNVVPGFNKDHQAFIVVKFPAADAARRWIGFLRPSISPAAEVLGFKSMMKRAATQAADPAPGMPSAVWANVALSAGGIQWLLGNANGLPPEFVENDAPGNPNSNGAHALLILAADHPEQLNAEFRRHLTALTTLGLEALAIFNGDALPGALSGHEHFGFKDGVSQPRIRGVDDLDKDGGEVPSDQFILEPDGDVPEWMRDGSFLVFVQLHQSVFEFRQSLAAAAQQRGLDSDQLMRAIVGRDQDGNRLAPGSEWSHINRARPGTDVLPADEVQKHRIIRRGIAYGPPLPESAEADDGVDRGLLFVAYQSSIAEQFLHVWNQWMNAGFPGGHDGVDGLVGQDAANDQRTVTARIDEGGDKIDLRLPRYVAPQYGGYFFSPSLATLAAFETAQPVATQTTAGDSRMTTTTTGSGPDKDTIAEVLRYLLQVAADGSSNGSWKPAGAGVSTIAGAVTPGDLNGIIPGGDLGAFVSSQFPYGAYQNLTLLGIDVFGVAQDNSPTNPYKGTTAQVKAADQYMSWQAGQPYDVTKAIRVRYTYTPSPGAEPMEEHLLIGFAGPPWIAVHLP